MNFFHKVIGHFIPEESPNKIFFIAIVLPFLDGFIVVDDVSKT